MNKYDRPRIPGCFLGFRKVLSSSDLELLEVVKMTKFGSLGFVALFSGIITLLLQGIVFLTSRDLAWKDLRFMDVLDPRLYTWVNDIHLLSFDVCSNYILNLPLYLVFFSLTVLFFAMNGLFGK
jgi:hypothetical protein